MVIHCSQLILDKIADLNYFIDKYLLSNVNCDILKDFENKINIKEKNKHKFYPTGESLHILTGAFQGNHDVFYDNVYKGEEISIYNNFQPREINIKFTFIVIGNNVLVNEVERE